MKKIIFSACAFLALTASAQEPQYMRVQLQNGETDYYKVDDITSVLFSTTEAPVIEVPEIVTTDANKLDFSNTYSQEEVQAAISNLANLLGNSVNAQNCLRGAKESTMPVAHAYQMQYCLGPDNYCGYTVIPHHDFPYSEADLASTYAIDTHLNGGPRGNYGLVRNYLIPLLSDENINKIPEVKAVNLLYYCIAAQEVADVSGPFSYTNDKQGAEEVEKYDDLRSIYYNIEADLDNIVACLKNFEQRPDWYKQEIIQIFSTYMTSRCALTGDFTPFAESCWRTANSLKLRMAMHMAKVEPETAQKWAEEAVASGVIETDNMAQALYPVISGFSNPLLEIFGSWHDNRLSASFESLLMSLDHPYTHIIFGNNDNEIVSNTGETLAADSRIVGIRAGQHVGEGQAYSGNQFIAYSGYSENGTYLMVNAPLYLVKFSEVDFLRAEGALRGWNMDGKAEDFYNRGILNASLDDPRDREWYEEDGAEGYDKYVDAYMNRTEPVAYQHVDPSDHSLDIASVTKIGVKWNEGDAQEVKLEKIITQKYISLYPLSTEAWTELRRTGYPKLFPVLNPEDGDGSLKLGDTTVQDAGNIIRRVPWVSDDAVIESSAIPALGGPDLQGTRLWWDVDKANF